MHSPTKQERSADRLPLQIKRRDQLCCCLQVPFGLNTIERVCALLSVPVLMRTSVQQRGPDSITS